MSVGRGTRRILGACLLSLAPEGVSAESMTISSPSQTEEDLHGYNMPKQYRCDSCKAIVYHTNEELQRRASGRRTLKEWEYEDIFDEVCKSPAYQEYGVEDIDGQTVLSGPGLPFNKKDMSKVQGLGSVKMKGGKWRRRLEEFCKTMINDVVGASNLYQMYHEDGKLFDDEICYRDTRDCETEETKRVLAEMDAKKANEAAKRSKSTKEKKGKNAEKALPKVNSGLNKAHEAQTQAAGQNGQLGIEVFLQRLASKHGLAADQYTKARTQQAWQKMVMDVAGRVLQSSHSDL